MRNLLIVLVKFLNKFIRKISYYTHALQHRLQWGFNPTPEWYDHFLDQYFGWAHRGQPFFVERGIFGLLAMKPQASVLELCCGDGFNTKNFYSHRAKSILAVDFDTEAIKHAKSNNSGGNITYQIADIRTQLPQSNYDNIVWDAAIEHFTEEESSAILKNIKKMLGSHGILSGYTLVEKDDGEKHLHQHEYEFKSKEDLVRFLDPWFKNVTVLETVYPERHNLYFYASDGGIPFDSTWSNISRVNK